MKKLLLGTILGGLAAFLWSSISWEVLPWHGKALLFFQDDDAVTAVIASNTTQSGTYLLPGPRGRQNPLQEGLTPAQKKDAQAAQMEKMRKGPILLMFAAVRREGFGSFAHALSFNSCPCLPPHSCSLGFFCRPAGSPMPDASHFLPSWAWRRALSPIFPTGTGGASPASTPP